MPDARAATQSSGHVGSSHVSSTESAQRSGGGVEAGFGRGGGGIEKDLSGEGGEGAVLRRSWEEGGGGAALRGMGLSWEGLEPLGGGDGGGDGGARET